jgi:molybdopterin converting factor subunit 1
MKVHVRLFSVAKDLAGFESRVLDLDSSATAGAVLVHLSKIHPGFEEWKSSLRMAVNCEYVQAAHRLREGDEVAVIPPVSGG